MRCRSSGEAPWACDFIILQLDCEQTGAGIECSRVDAHCRYWPWACGSHHPRWIGMMWVACQELVLWTYLATDSSHCAFFLKRRYVAELLLVRPTHVGAACSWSSFCSTPKLATRADLESHQLGLESLKLEGMQQNYPASSEFGSGFIR